jgi:hypothetical protein
MAAMYAVKVAHADHSRSHVSRDFIEFAEDFQNRSQLSAFSSQPSNPAT